MAQNDQQRSVKVDDIFIVACRNTGVTLEELEAKTAEDFQEGQNPSATNSPRGNKGGANTQQIPKDVLERRLKNYETLRLRKLHLVLVERDRLVKKGYVPSNDAGPSTPTASGAPPSSFDAAPPLSARKGSASNIPRPPRGGMARSGNNGRSSQNGGGSGSSVSDGPAPRAPRQQPSPRNATGSQQQQLNLEPLDFGDGKNDDNTSHLPAVNGASAASPTYEASANGTLTRSQHNQSYAPSNAVRSNTAMSNATNSGRARKSQREVLLEKAQRQHKQRVLQSQRMEQAKILKEIREEEQQRIAIEVRLKEEEDQRRREERQKMVQVSNQIQQENRARRDELLRQMREENARAHVEMGELELEAKANAIEEVRRRQAELVEQKKHNARMKNSMAMENAKDRQAALAMRQELLLEKKGLLASVYGANYSTSGATTPRSAALVTTNDDFNGTSASGGDGGNDTAAMGESARQRRLKKLQEEQRFQEKHDREAQRLAAAQQLVEENRMKTLKNIYEKEKRAHNHMAKEVAARDAYINQNYEVSMINMEKAKQTREQREQEARLYREMLEVERLETQQERDKRVYLESQLKAEDRMARDEWRRSVLERSKRHEELKQLDAEEKTRAKQEAADARRKALYDEIDAINSGMRDMEEQGYGGGYDDNGGDSRRQQQNGGRTSSSRNYNNSSSTGGRNGGYGDDERYTSSSRHNIEGDREPLALQ